MKLLKTIFITILFVGFTQCKTIKLTENPPFNITGAVYNNWVGGQPGVSGIKVNIGFSTTEAIVFDTLYFYKLTTKIEQRTVKGKTYIVGHFDTSTAQQERVEEEETIKKKTTTTKFPFDLKENEAVISYKIGTKLKYYKVTNIKKTKTDYYP